MAVFKCKMCGGALEIQNNESVATCEYCGTQQTVSQPNNSKQTEETTQSSKPTKNRKLLVVIVVLVALVFSVPNVVAVFLSKAPTNEPSSSLSTSSEETIIVAVEADFYPFSYKENGEFVGIHIDMAKEMAHRLNRNVEFVPAYFEQLIDGVDKGQYDIAFGLEQTSEREELVMFTDPYYDGMCIIFSGETFAEYSNITVTLKNMLNDGTVKNIFSKYNIVLQ